MMRNELATSEYITPLTMDSLPAGSKIEDAAEPAVSSKPQTVIGGSMKLWIKIFMRLRLMFIVFINYTNPLCTFNVLRKLLMLRRSMMGERGVNKFIKVNGKYYCDLYTPGIPSIASRKFIESEAHRINPLPGKANRFVNVFLCITKSCPLRCEHCFEWDAINKPDTLTLEDIASIVSKVQEMGCSQVQITGGEPLTNPGRLMEVIQLIDKDTESWLLTSGYNLTPLNAQRLRSAGLTGVVVSLDHFEPMMHNRFRGSPHAFQWATEAIKNSLDHNLVTALSLCATNSFISPSNLMAYAELAKHLGVAFIQLLEPMDAGHYQSQSVTLTQGNQKILEDFYYKLNYDKEFRSYPIVCYHGQYNRRVGCFSSGNRNLYIDTDGDLQACPFCRSKLGSFLSPEADKIILGYRESGCKRYSNISG